MNHNLTADEKNVLVHLVNAWNAWVSLGNKHPDDDHEFRTVIHHLQQMIACRVARRVDPDMWWQPAVGDKGTKAEDVPTVQ